MPDTAIAVFTGKPLENILKEGSGNWALNADRARTFQYLVCCRSGVYWADKKEEKDSAFLIAIISDIVPWEGDRWIIKFSDYALVNIPHVWKGWRNPVRYTTLQELGLDPASLVFQKVEIMSSHNNNQEDRSLTIDEAKAGLSRTFGVPKGSIEIVIKY